MADSFFHLETRAGSPVQAGGNTIIPMARALRLRFPGLNGGLIWNRPVSVVVRDAAGQEQVLPVRDVTRQAQLGLLAGTVLGMLALWLLSRPRGQRRP